MKIWAKIIKDEKIKNSILYDSCDNLELVSCLQELCEQMDIPTPILTATTEGYFFEFNIAKFRPSDFVEKVDFDILEIERA